MNFNLDVFDIYLINLFLFGIYNVFLGVKKLRLKFKLNAEWHLGLMLVHVFVILFIYERMFFDEGIFWKYYYLLFMLGNELLLVIVIMKNRPDEFCKSDFLFSIIFLLITDSQMFFTFK